jgi:hypothetical protein
VLDCNTDPHTRPGSYWIAIYIREDVHYFDSFGRKPELIFKRLMDKHCKNWTFKDVELQSSGIFPDITAYFIACFVIGIF